MKSRVANLEQLYKVACYQAETYKAQRDNLLAALQEIYNLAKIPGPATGLQAVSAFRIAYTALADAGHDPAAIKEVEQV
jgi:hypothetical protein